MAEQLLLLLTTLIAVALVSYPADLVRRRSPSRAGAAQVATVAVLVLAVAGASAAGVVQGAAGVVALVTGILLGSVVADQIAARVPSPIDGSATETTPDA